MKKFLLFFVLSLICVAQSKEIKLHKNTTPIKIDGVIDDAWKNADSSDSFFQLSPFFNKELKNKTIVKTISDGTSMYFLFICYQDPSTIKANAGKLDENTGDIVAVEFDSFNDKKSAYKFAVNASGVRMDARLLDDARNRDYNWDGVWFAASRIYNFGYVVEIEIPFKSIQYEDNLTSWGIDFDRWTNYNKEDDYWASYSENEGQRISKFGRLVFSDFYPNVRDLNLEVYPVGIAKANYLYDDKYKIKPDAGLDIFYNPSQKLTLQFSANPDFAQIEADPFSFNISRYETYYNEKRPFFTQGNEVFSPSGKQTNSGFYSPLELFYSRRIGKKLDDGSEVPLYFGTKIFGRLDGYEYGGFLARTGSMDYFDNDGNKQTELAAYFGAARLKTQIFGNSSLGVLFVGKSNKDNNYGVLDVDGALRGDDWQLAYQIARSFENEKGDYAASFGLNKMTDSWIYLARSKFIGKNFDISQIGYVPWKGLSSFTGLTGPRWYYKEGILQSLMFYAGVYATYEHADLYTDLGGIFGLNMSFRNNWGFEIDIDGGRSKDNAVLYNSYEATFSSWYDISNKWSGNLYGGYTKTYNFDRDWLAPYSWAGIYLEWTPVAILNLGTSFDLYAEFNPQNKIAEITYNARPFIAVTPFNDFSVRVYVDNLYLRSTKQMEHIIGGFLVSYNFLPKSWIYLAINELHDRSDVNGDNVYNKMQLVDRAAVLKIKYLYYF